MSLNKAGRGRWDLECDHCSNYEELEGDFDDAVAEMKKLGWRYEGDGQHICASCIEDDEDFMSKAI